MSSAEPEGASPAPGRLQSAAEVAELFVQFASAQRHVLWVVDLLPKERVAYVSPAFEVVWGRGAAELYADSRLWAQAIHPDDRAGVAEVFGRWIDDPLAHGYDVEYRIVRPDGGLRWIRDSGQAPLASARDRGRRTGIAEDITERRNAIDALRSEQQRLAAITEVAPSVLHSFRRGADGHTSFPYGGARLAQLYGLPPGAIDADASVLATLIHPDDLAPLNASMAQSARELSPWRTEFRIRHADGGERWIEVHATPVPGHDGSTAWHGSASDTTARKSAERALLESQRRLMAVVAHMSEGLLVYSADGKLSEWNPAALAMHEFDDARARGISVTEATRLFELRTLAGELLPLAQWPHTRLMAGERLHQLELRLRRTDTGWEKVLSYSGSRVDDAQGRPLFGVLQFSDVTARRRNEEEITRLNGQLEQRVAERTAELQAAVKELEAFSYSVSHDLRAPLRALDGFSQALIEDHGKLLPEGGRRYLSIIRETAQKMGQLIDDLLAFSRLGRQSLTRRRVNATQLVRHAFDALAPQCQGRQIEFVVADLPPCEADLALLRQVWINLLGNAVKYTRQRDPAVIEVGSGTDAQGVTEYFVRDNGAGFDMRYAHKLFGVFERLHRADEFEGTGVGLAIVQRIVQRHGGQVRAVGEAGHGATFFFTLGPPDAPGRPGPGDSSCR
jgi:PAS domain S-box-containing protein